MVVQCSVWCHQVSVHHHSWHFSNLIHLCQFVFLLACLECCFPGLAHERYQLVAVLLLCFVLQGYDACCKSTIKVVCLFVGRVCKNLYIMCRHTVGSFNKVLTERFYAHTHIYFHTIYLVRLYGNDVWACVVWSFERDKAHTVFHRLSRSELNIVACLVLDICSVVVEPIFKFHRIDGSVRLIVHIEHIKDRCVGFSHLLWEIVCSIEIVKLQPFQFRR